MVMVGNDYEADGGGLRETRSFRFFLVNMDHIMTVKGHVKTELWCSFWDSLTFYRQIHRAIVLGGIWLIPLLYCGLS